MGPVEFLIFYLLCGFAAAAAHVLSSPGSIVPTVGASGTISGVLGGYLLLFPRNRVRVLTRDGVAYVPAILVLGLWIVIQLFSSLGSLAQTADTGGVAFLAHVGGFVAGDELRPACCRLVREWLERTGRWRPTVGDVLIAHAFCPNSVMPPINVVRSST